MTHRGGNPVKRTMLISSNGRVVATASTLPLFGAPDLDDARRERDRLMHKLLHQRMEARSRIRTEQKLTLIVAKIMRLEMQMGTRQ